MKEYTIMNKATKEYNVIFGYNWKDAVRRSGIIPNSWKLIRVDYEEFEMDYE